MKNEVSLLLLCIQFTFGLILLSSGGYFLTQGIRFLSSILNVPVFFISFLIIGIGTSAPELFVTLMSHFKGESQLAIANVLGSNIFNILVVLGVSMIGKLVIEDRKSIIKSTGLLFFCTLMVIPLALDQEISRLDGLLLLGMFILFLKSQSQKKASLHKSSSSLLPLGYTALGFILLFWGSHQTISAAQNLGEILGMSARLQGLFLLSIGTSLPELVVAMVSLIKKESDITFGSIIGSNVFNTFLIPGLAAVLAPLTLSQKLITIDGLTVLISTFVLLGIMCLFKRVPRYFSFFFILAYCFYAWFVLLS